MKSIINKIRTEPALLISLVSAIILLAVNFGVELSDDQQGAIIGVVIALSALVIRSKVSPVIES